MNWIKQLFSRRHLYGDLNAEIKAHLAEKVDELVASGLSREEAATAARREFGNVLLTEERSREVWQWPALENFFMDVRYGARQLRRNPGFTASAVLTLALGIGANTAIFTVVRSVLLKPLAYRDADRLVIVTGGATAERFDEIIAAARSFSGLGAYALGKENVTLSGVAVPEALNGARVSGNFLEILGVKPLLGRSFLPGEDSAGGRPVAMISAELWQRRFGGDRMITSKIVTLNSTAYTIIGVLPRHFQFPFAGVDAWVTRPAEWSVIPPPRTFSPILTVFGRLKPHVSLDQARAEVAVINRQYALSHPVMLDAKPNPTDAVIPLKDKLVTDVRSMLWMLYGAVAFVLLIACANVASLLLARAAFRAREFALRAALGAARGRLIAQFLTESMLLAFSGGALGVLLAKWCLRAFTRMSAYDLPRTGDIRLDGPVLGFAVALSIATGILFGLLPALGASRPGLAGALRTAGRATSGGGGNPTTIQFTTRGLLVAGQVALSVVLSIGAALLMESLIRVQAVHPGFQPANILTLKIALPPARYDSDQKRAAFFEEVVRRVESLPGVRSAAVTLTLPMTGFTGAPVQVVEQPPVKLNQRPIAIVQSITPGYFRTLEIPLRRGREFDARDASGALPVGIISESLARRFWPPYPKGPEPIGQHLFIEAKHPFEIVGIVADIHQANLEIDVRPGVYRPWPQNPWQSGMLAVRTPGDPLLFVNAVRNQILAIDPDQPVSDVQTMDEVVEQSLGERRLIMLLIGAFAGVAILLAVVGIYGVLAYSVAHRTPEIGIRRALGAQHVNILRLVVGQGLGLALIGLVAGTAAALALTRVMRGLLFHVSARDPAAFVEVGFLFVVVALLASYIPARRAAKVDPMVALRYE